MFDQNTDKNNSIAVVGMACVFPGAHSPEELWQNALAERRYFRKFPDERLPRKDYYDADLDAPAKTYSDFMAVITGWSFDPVAFRVPPVTVEASDIAHWIALATTHAAIRDSGIDLTKQDRSRTGIILGNTLTGEFSRSINLRLRWPYVQRAVRRALEKSGIADSQAEALIESVSYYYNSPLPDITEDSLAGNMSNTIAGRICNYFDLGGAGFTVDGACSSSLLAIAHACNALIKGEMDIVLSGGVDISLDPFELVGFAKARALAIDDTRPYDERAAGMLPGEGCGMFVLMREEDAQAQELRIHALIRGWGYSADGAGAITAPGVEGQMRALRKAYECAGYPIAAVRLFEGHGTGTALGDKVEITAIHKLLEEAGSVEPAYIGSIKGNIGHCKAAAGSAGLVKAVMALKRKIMPPTGNCRRPSPVFGKPMSRLIPLVEGAAWERGVYPRRASVSAMGFGGANAHLALEEANPGTEASAEDLAILGSSRDSELFVLSAPTPERMHERVQKLRVLSERISRAEFTDLSAALAEEPLSGDLRLALVADAPWTLATALRSVEEQLKHDVPLDHISDPDTGIFARRAKEHPVLAMLFPGQGSQFVNMGEGPRRNFPFVRDFVRRTDESLHDILPRGISRFIQWENFTRTDEACRRFERCLQDTKNTQPAIAMSSVSMLKVLDFMGLKPDVVLGHSLGEVVAYHAAGCIDDASAVRIAALRGQAMASLSGNDAGGMAAIGIDAAAVEQLIRSCGLDVTISNYNSPKQTVVSGGTDAVDAFLEECKKKGIRSIKLPVSHAFHSPLVAPASRLFLKNIRNFSFSRPQCCMITTVTGREINANDCVPDRLSEQIVAPVRFIEAVRSASEKKPDLWLEVGPGGVLSSLLRSILRDKNSAVLPTDIAHDDASRLLNAVLAVAFVIGFPVRRDRLFAYRFHRPFSLDSYDPKFITNPCERPVAEANAAPAAFAPSTASTLAPDGVPADLFANYLAMRKDFLKDFIAVDFRHTVGKRADAPVLGSPSAAVPMHIVSPQAAVAASPVARTTGDVMEYAIAWIAKRTGFPAGSIKPAMKLRQDLNLDSIKAGELTISLSRKFNGVFSTDSSSLANATIAEIVEALQIPTTGDTGKQASLQNAPLSLDEGMPAPVRTFCIAPMPAPLSEEPARPLPALSRILVCAAPEAPPADAIVSAISGGGFTPQLYEAYPGFTGDDLPEHAGIIVVLPEEDKTFFECPSDSFTHRTEYFATTFFQLVRGMIRRGVETGSAPRLIVLRPAVSPDKGADYDAMSGLLKTVSLEHPGALLKWITVPREWPASRCAAVALNEMQTAGRKISYSYAADGTRSTEAAFAKTNQDETPFNMSHEDVVLVSGGAKGITHELAFNLARKTGVKLAILGSTPLVQTTGTEPPEVQQSLDRYKRAGIEYRYYQADITDLDAVLRAVKHAEQDLGPITGIFHGAGISRLKLFLEMDLHAFLKVIRVKIRGLYNMMRAVDTDRLKMLHVLSSVLGKTGMKGQADYTFANAWLDAAVTIVHRTRPRIHCLSLGYSVWAETGLGKKLGVVGSLAAQGITTISTEDGVNAYLSLLDHPSVPTVVILGRMTPELETDLFARIHTGHGRFLEKVRRWIPGGEVVADAVISAASDRYIAEHVFHGTQVFPGVMAMEAMGQAAIVCTGSSEPPVFRDIRFLRPLIIPDGSSIVMRTIAVMDTATPSESVVSVVIRSDMDNFASNHFEGLCVFETKRRGASWTPDPPAVREPLAIDPECFNPAPLFQGKFFRRISRVFLREEGRESLTEVVVPDGERYFNGEFAGSQPLSSPAVRDAFFQTGALILPSGYLPVGIGEVRFHRPLIPGAAVVCHARGRKLGDGKYEADIAVFSGGGGLLETIKGVLLEAPRTEPEGYRPPASPASLPDIEKGLQTISGNRPLAVAAVDIDDDRGTRFPEITADDITKIHSTVSQPRRAAAVAELAAVRKAAVAYARKYLSIDLPPLHVHLRPDGTGKPALAFNAQSLAQAFENVEISLSDSGEIAVALVSRFRIGIDIELVENRTCEMWQALLGDDGYALARRIATVSHETFDAAATRVWTIIEAGKKANVLERVLPDSEISRRDAWIDLTGKGLLGETRFIGAVVENKTRSAITLAVTAALGAPSHQPMVSGDDRENPQSVQSGSSFHDAEKIIDRALAGLLEGSENLRPIVRNDPADERTEEHFKRYSENVSSFMETMRSYEKMLSPDIVKQKQRKMYDDMTRIYSDSVVFRRALVKPFGYPGDHVLLDMMFHGTIPSRGLGYHVDRYFQTYPGTEAVRRRSRWVIDRILDVIGRMNPSGLLSILDLGCGPMCIEKSILEQATPDVKLAVQGLDFDERALRFATQKLDDPRVHLDTRQVNLVSPEGLGAIRSSAERADICICMGLIEYLEADAATAIYAALHAGSRPGTRIFTSNYRPGHAAVPLMEWLLDWWLVYRNEDDMMAIAKNAGFTEHNISMTRDETDSIVLVEMER
ncbi:MAG TPA: SDR family NAD(P)-dependent oxidoreductase [Nitrospirota bacterium]|nr:SDR family NAD(P)-dependent oxidoreductase [Nitrospirota bacterium]